MYSRSRDAQEVPRSASTLWPHPEETVLGGALSARTSQRRSATRPMATLPPVSPAAFRCSDTIRNSPGHSKRRTRFSTFLRAHRGAELIHDFTGGLNRRRVLIHIERDGPHARMTASAVALTNLRQIDRGLQGSPGIRSHRNLHAEAALAQPHAVDRFRMQVVGNELVVAFEILIRDVEKNRTVFALGPLPQDLD